MGIVLVLLLAELLLMPHYRGTVYVLGNLALAVGIARGIWLQSHPWEPLRVATNMRILRARPPLGRPHTETDENHLRRAA